MHIPRMDKLWIDKRWIGQTPDGTNHGQRHFLIKQSITLDIKGILRWPAIFSYMLELTYVMVESWKKNRDSSILTLKPALESLSLALKYAYQKKTWALKFGYRNKTQHWLLTIRCYSIVKQVNMDELGFFFQLSTIT